MDKRSYNLAIEECLKRLAPGELGFQPSIALAMGSGFQSLLDSFPIEQTIDYAELPGFPVPGVKGHGSNIAVIKTGSLRMLILCGRAHYYEGCSMEEITFPIRALAAAGVKEIILTNAAGGINPNFAQGDFMLFTDHINFMGASPLRGQMSLFGDCFLDVAGMYRSNLSALLVESAANCGMPLRQGVYAAVCGPNYETPAEIRAFGALGADAVGMSTVPEAIVAHHCRMQVAAVSCITNMAAGIHPGKISHQEVLGQSSACAAKATRLIQAFAKSRAAITGSSAKDSARQGACATSLEFAK